MEGDAILAKLHIIRFECFISETNAVSVAIRSNFIRLLHICVDCSNNYLIIQRVFAAEMFEQF